MSNHEPAKKKLLNYLSEGRDKILSLKQKTALGQNFRRFLAELGLSKVTMRDMLGNLKKQEKKAEQFVEKNPKKAVAWAAVGGILAGSLWSSLKGKRPVLKKKDRSLSIKP